MPLLICTPFLLLTRKTSFLLLPMVTPPAILPLRLVSASPLSPEHSMNFFPIKNPSLWSSFQALCNCYMHHSHPDCCWQGCQCLPGCQRHWDHYPLPSLHPVHQKCSEETLI